MPAVAAGFGTNTRSRYNEPMANRAYASIWCQDFSESVQLQRFGALLATVPFSESRPGFTEMIIRAVSPAETPLREVDARSNPLQAADIVEVAGESLHSDCAYEVQSTWDVWTYNQPELKWERRPGLLEIIWHGTDYDDAAWQMNGHFQIDLGFEHLFTGHAGLLGIRRAASVHPQHPTEAAFFAAVSAPGKITEYHEKTRENIRKLLDWMQRIEANLALEQLRLWSEGEENFEARLEEILAVR
jgi:hypothetical protein